MRFRVNGIAHQCLASWCGHGDGQDRKCYWRERLVEGVGVRGYGAAAKGNTLLNFAGIPIGSVAVCHGQDSGEAKEIPTGQPYPDR